jgi:hypothetical protein
MYFSAVWKIVHSIIVKLITNILAIKYCCDKYPAQMHMQGWSFIWSELNFLQAWKIDWNWLESVCFYSVAIISHRRKVLPSIWTNLDPLFPKDDLCQVWLILAQRFWRRNQLTQTELRTTGDQKLSAQASQNHVLYQDRLIHVEWNMWKTEIDIKYR